MSQLSVVQYWDLVKEQTQGHCAMLTHAIPSIPCGTIGRDKRSRVRLPRADNNTINHLISEQLETVPAHSLSH